MSAEYCAKKCAEKDAEIERLRAALKISGHALSRHLSHAVSVADGRRELQEALNAIRAIDAFQQSDPR